MNDDFPEDDGYVDGHPFNLAPITDQPLLTGRGPAVTVLLPIHRAGADALPARYGRI